VAAETSSCLPADAALTAAIAGGSAPDADPCFGFDDGSEVVESGTNNNPEWSALRVSFLDVDVRNAPPAVPPAAGAGVLYQRTDNAGADVLYRRDPADAAAAAKKDSPGKGKDDSSAAAADTFQTSELEDELVSLACEVASALRGERVLAEAVWAEAGT
jgi:hypothetical protein